jgi:hypothetical protein
MALGSNLLVSHLPQKSPIHPDSYFLEDPNYSATAGMDAVLKCLRFANVGNAAGHLELHASMFFNAVENQVQEVDEQGRRVAV